MSDFYIGLLIDITLGVYICVGFYYLGVVSAFTKERILLGQSLFIVWVVPLLMLYNKIRGLFKSNK